MKNEWIKFKKCLTNCELDTIPNQSLRIWRGQEKSIQFSEESSRKIHELGNIELHELGPKSEPSSASLEAYTGGIDLLRLQHLSST